MPALLSAQYPGGDGGGSYRVQVTGQSALPVELFSFTLYVNENYVKLNWVTDREFNNSGFDIERKSFNGEWAKIGYVKGNGNIASNYSLEDRNLQTGNYSYRLKQIDINGNFEYHNLSTEVEIGVPGKFDLSRNYPNPFNPTTKIDFNLPFDSRVNVVIYDMTGREVMTIVNSILSAGYYTEILNLSNLTSGTYFYRLTAKSYNNEYVSTKKMTFVK